MRTLRIHAIAAGILMGAALAGLVSCQGATSDSAPNIQAALAAKYFQTNTNITVNVAYETGAEPFVGTTATGRTLWTIFKDNLTEIFKYRSQLPTVTVPSTLAQMTSFPAQSKSSWTVDQLKALHTQFGSGTDSTTTSYLHLYFVRGYYNDGTGPQSGVLGVSVGGTSFVVIFKDVVESSGGTAVQKFVEQSTMVHEMGHAIGFVNNGVTMTSAYQDTAHGKHSSNTDCVMYWQNEGASGLSAFVVKYLTSSSVIMWGPEVLADAQAFSR